jgi:cellulose synthase (UDP-forming)
MDIQEITRGGKTAVRELPRRSVAVLIACKNGEATIANAVRSAVEQADIFVVSDGSTDRTVEEARAVGARVLPLSKSLGKPGALRAGNAAFALTRRYEYVAVLDDDTTLAPAYMARLTKKLDADDSIAAASGRIDSVCDHARRWNPLIAMRAFTCWSYQATIKRGQNALRVVNVPCGANSVFRARVFEQLISNDASYAIEDMDWLAEIVRQRMGRVEYVHAARSWTIDPKRPGRRDQRPEESHRIGGAAWRRMGARGDLCERALSEESRSNASLDQGRGGRCRSEPVVTGAARVGWWLMAVAWAGVTVSFWVWWLRHAATGTPWLYWPQTACLLYQSTALPAFFFYYVGKMRRPIERRPPDGLRVALIALCVPTHESLPVIRAQLEALHGVTYPHDSWILDEGGSEDVRAMASELGVRYFTRRDVAAWNEPHPPFQAKTKAGNVNAWLDHIGEGGVEYDVFVQFDIDHQPHPDYLDRVLGYFHDPAVAWVQSPSVCGNLDEWTARGLAEQDMLFHGPLQMGFYGASETPFIVGSHTAYRLAAVREIGGFQPTRAEDHLDTVVLAAHGYKGVYVPEIIAVGAGPRDFTTYLRQQFAWAYSMIEIFFRHTPRLLRHYSVRQALQFLMCQSWYTLWSLSLAILWLLPIVALIVQKPIAWVPVGEFLVYFLPVPLMSTLMWFWARRWFQPKGLLLSWRGLLLEIARWPVVVWALINVLLRVDHGYMITPKGVAGGKAVRLLRVYGPYVGLVTIPIVALWADLLNENAGALSGYYGLVLLNAAGGVALLVTTLLLELRSVSESGAVGAASVRARVSILASVLSLLGVFAVTTLATWGPFLEAIRP